MYICTYVKSKLNPSPLLMQWTSNYYRIVYYLVRSPALVFISAIGEIASAYVTIAVSNRVKRMRNGNLN